MCLKFVNGLIIMVLKQSWKTSFFSKPIRTLTKKIMGVRIDSDVTFKEHITSICSKANQKLHALPRVSKDMALQKRHIPMKLFITSQFNYCPTAWMCLSRNLNNKVNHIHERAPCLVHQLSFSALLIKNNLFTIHQRSLQLLLAVEIFEVKMNILLRS